MKNKLKIIDNTFSHSILGYCSDFQESENFMWDRSQSNREDNLVITDNFLTSNLPQSKNKIAWLIEPVCVAPQHYEYVKNNLMKFDYILTHEKTLLDIDYPTQFIPFGCCWIPKEEQQIYNKSKNISIISSNSKRIASEWPSNNLSSTIAKLHMCVMIPIFCSICSFGVIIFP